MYRNVFNSRSILRHLKIESYLIHYVTMATTKEKEKKEKRKEKKEKERKKKEEKDWPTAVPPPPPKRYTRSDGTYPDSYTRSEGTFPWELFLAFGKLFDSYQSSHWARWATCYIKKMRLDVGYPTSPTTVTWLCSHREILRKNSKNFQEMS